jgi:hypothetical protein
MAGKSSVQFVGAASDGLFTGDMQLLLNQWFTSQRDLLDTGVDRLAQTQRELLKVWLGLVDELGKPWEAMTENGLRFPWNGFEDLYQAVPQPLATWWSPWAPFLERGGEQLA